MRAIIGMLATVIFLATASMPANAADTVHGSLRIVDPWSKATIGKNGAAYFMIMNHGDQMDRLVGVETPATDKAEIHTHLMEDGVMKMRQIKAIEVHPGAPAVLKPGGDHIMLFNLKKKWVTGETMPLTLVFERAGKVDVMVNIMPWNASGEGHGMSTTMDHDETALKEEAKGLMKKFAGELKGELVSAMKSGGPLNAIGVCNVKAPQIADKISEASGWTVARSSHKLRNPSNEADDFTAKAIAEFLARQANGEKPGTMVKAGISEENGARVFRMVKAIPTGKVCLACHGAETVTPEVEAALMEHYPDDKARGFKIGEMRGVFTLKKELN
ncbi:MAG: copper chaperone PCu(A)C [Rhizobiales bacterium]|nr:copper chaperone PCu(A)C [Hyphomicrobiales bacterium]